MYLKLLPIITVITSEYIWKFAQHDIIQLFSNNSKFSNLLNYIFYVQLQNNFPVYIFILSQHQITNKNNFIIKNHVTNILF